MNASATRDANQALRQGVYWIFIAVAAGALTGRVFAVNSVNVEKLEQYRIDQRVNDTKKELIANGVEGDDLEERLAARREDVTAKLRMQRPFLSSNDRSRWATVRSLVELGTYQIDGIVEEPTWDTIDMVSHQGRDGEKHLYSSKPPILATLIAGEYWIVHTLTGKTLGSHPYELGRFMLLTINLPLFVVMLALIARLVDRFGETDFGRMFVMAAAAFGTLLSSFLVVLNNHLFAATSVTVALYAVTRIACDDERRGRYFVAAGLASAFAVATELPALALFAIVAAALLWICPRRTLIWFAPAAAAIAAVFFGTNYAAHDTFRPPYAHRHADDPDKNWYHYTFMRDGRERDSYWKNPQGIDRGEPDKGTYALHALVGHHGVFSLTPVWLFSMVGAGMWLLGARPANREGDLREDDSRSVETNGAIARNARRFIATTAALLTVVCLVFFILMRPQEDRNYGGMTNGFRWLFWLYPIWLVAMLPAADWLSRRRVTRGIGYLALAASVLSASYATWNPWSQPWIANFFTYMGWVTFQ